MKPLVVLLAGYPGTGKSYLANEIMKNFSDFVLCSPDNIKEEYWDRYGFETLEEKEILITKSWETYYHRMETILKRGNSVISDYPFSEKQKNRLSACINENNARAMTIRLVGDLDILFERQKRRDLSNTRHLGHIVRKYHKGMDIKHSEADNLLSKEEFKKRCTTRGYGEFELGILIEIDVSNFDEVNYDAVIKQIEILKEC